MADDPMTAKAEAYMDRDFLPTSGSLNESLRNANSAEYSAHQLGRIRKAVERIADALEKIAAKP